jgi:biopolymer transport protein ExbD
MAFGRFHAGGEPFRPISDINVTPLVDVTLVLLIVFIITAPLLTYAIKLELPDARSSPAAAPPAAINLSIDAAGAMYWNGSALGPKGLQERLKQAASQVPQPELHLRADRSARYEFVARTLASAQQAGIRHIGFVTDPNARDARAPAAQP